MIQGIQLYLNCKTWHCYILSFLQDTAIFALNFQAETPIKQGVYSSQDVRLQDRVLAQVCTLYVREILDSTFSNYIDQQLFVNTQLSN